MRREKLGDSLDHLKGAVIVACEESVAENIHVVPMISDSVPWTTNDVAWTCYSWVTRRGSDLILNKDKPFSFVQDTSIPRPQRYETWMETREEYFASLSNFKGDLFLDPDTGIAANNVESAYLKSTPKRNDHAFIHRHELRDLAAGTKRVLIVYQHKHQGNPSGYLKVTMNGLEEIGLRCFGYSLTHASILFISRSSNRITKLKRHFELKLTGASGRITA